MRPQTIWASRGGAALINRMLFRWRELIEAGFPFMKVHLLRENLSSQDIGGWRGIFAVRGGDVDLIALHLGGVDPRAPGLRTESILRNKPPAGTPRPASGPRACAPVDYYEL